MIASYLSAAIALAIISGVALGKSPSQATASPHSSVSVANERRGIYGNRIESPSGTTVDAESPMRNDDIPKTIQFARPASETASR
jgi:hypothetical protein